MNYWGYRIDNRNRDFIFEEIKNDKLRQGWGYAGNQDLTLGDKVDVSARRNFPIYNKVKKDDYLLVPHLEAWDEITIVRAKEDFNVGYSFSIPDCGDYGHIFPVKYVKKFSRYNINVDGVIRETFKCRSRFWNINRCEKEIEKLLAIDEKELIDTSNYSDRFKKNVMAVFEEDSFAENLYNRLNDSSQASEWEFILCEGFKQIMPKSYTIQTTSNREEYNHGADILIRIPGILDTTYVIAIQVKDYKDVVNTDVINQICKSDEYFKNEGEGEVLIDKYVIITKAPKELNTQLKEEADNRKVKILFDKDVKKLLSKMSKPFLNDTIFE